MGRRTEGSKLLAATGLDHAAIAAALGVSRAAVTQWLSGDKRPAHGRRAAIEQLYGVPPAAWDAELSEPVLGPAQAKTDPCACSTGFHAEARLRDQLERLDAIRTAAADDATMPPQARLRLEATTTRCIELLAKLTGEGQEVSEARILRLPAWRRIQDAIIAALRPYPDAAVAVAKALKELGG